MAALGFFCLVAGAADGVDATGRGAALFLASATVAVFSFGFSAA